MFNSRFDSSVRILALAAISLLTACAKHVTTATPPAPTPAAAPAPVAAEPAKPAVQPPQPAAAPAPQPVQVNLRDVFFNYDDAAIRSDQAPATQESAAFLGQHSKDTVVIEGHCDDRGSAMYNLALGERRANAVKETLVRQGVDASRIRTVSYGKEKPFCTDENEQCWQQNRRGHIVAQK